MKTAMKFTSKLQPKKRFDMVKQREIDITVYTIWIIIYAFSDEIVSQYASTNAELTKLLAENDAIVSNVEESTTLQYTTEQGNF